ncbi:MAG TPA: hypothetical protein VGU24_04860 [Microvirga sp.]|jgi:hypothetical protein|nr:hypothetical protein [Microvirga sp.]
MPQVLRVWNALLRRGRPGEVVVLVILLALAPTVMVYMLVLDATCWTRDALGLGTRPISKRPHDATVAVIALLCIPMLLLNLAALVALPAWLLFG